MPLAEIKVSTFRPKRLAIDGEAVPRADRIGRHLEGDGGRGQGGRVLAGIGRAGSQLRRDVFEEDVLGGILGGEEAPSAWGRKGRGPGRLSTKARAAIRARAIASPAFAGSRLLRARRLSRVTSGREAARISAARLAGRARGRPGTASRPSPPSPRTVSRARGARGRPSRRGTARAPIDRSVAVEGRLRGRPSFAYLLARYDAFHGFVPVLSTIRRATL